ncbi:MAG: putative methyltransferase [Alcanivorax sp.]|jgi:predicted methyltransferase
MKKLVSKLALTVASTLGMGLVGGAVQASDFEPIEAKLKAAMASDIRTDAETARDKNRKPLQTLEFFGLREDMTVVELLPGGGWYTKLLAPVLAENGKLYIAYGADRTQAALQDFSGFEDVEVIGADTKMGRSEGARLYFANNTDLGVGNVDMVLTFRNYHNFDQDSRNAINVSAYKALKPGGTYALVDHTRRHMQKIDSENRRRFDPVEAIKEIQAAGFEFVDYSDLHYRADDELRYEVGRATVTGNTDRWTLKFRKP